MTNKIMDSKAFLLAVSVLFLFVSIAGASDPVVKDADAVWSPDLDAAPAEFTETASGVESRPVIDYPNAVTNFELKECPKELFSDAGVSSSRPLVEYADTVWSKPLTKPAIQPGPADGPVDGPNFIEELIEAVTGGFVKTPASCEWGFKDCTPPSGDCETNLFQDNNNCGECGKRCPEDNLCLLGSCLENTTANKERLASYYMGEYGRYDGEGKLENAENYLLKARDVYVDLGRDGQVEEIDDLVETLEKKIENKELMEEVVALVFELFVALLLALIYAYIFERKKDVKRILIVSSVIFFIAFLVLRLFIVPFFYNSIVIKVILAFLAGVLASFVINRIAKRKGIVKWILILSVFIFVSLVTFLLMHFLI